MQFPTPLFEGRLVRRYKRFLADVEMREGPDAGTVQTVHCPNPGSMLGLARPGAPVWVSRSDNQRRKLACTWELEQVDGPGPACLVGINTGHPNRLAEEAVLAGLVPQLGPFVGLRREQRYGESSRIDLLGQDQGGGLTFIEVKNVHMMRRAGHLEFPDCVTARGAKHLRELAAMVTAGHRAVLLFVAQWPGAASVGLARDIDPGYGEAMDAARAAGVEVLALDCNVTTHAITPVGTLPFHTGYAKP